MSSISGPLTRPVAAAEGIKLFLEKEWVWVDDDDSWGGFLSSAQPFLASPPQPLLTSAPFLGHCSSRGGACLWLLTLTRPEQFTGPQQPFLGSSLWGWPWAWCWGQGRGADRGLKGSIRKAQSMGESSALAVFLHSGIRVPSFARPDVLTCQ